MTPRQLPRGPRRRPRGRAGFTLVSVIIAMVLLNVGVLALAGAMQVSMRVVNTENTRNTALQLARSYLEQVRGRNPDLLTTEPTTRIDETGAVNVNGRYQRTLTVAALTDTTLIRVRVDVASLSGARPVSMETLVFRPIW